MSAPNIILGIIGFANIVGLAFILFKITAKSVAPVGEDAILKQKNEEIGELKTALKEMRSEMDEKAGKSKQLYENYKNLEADMKILRKERDDLSARVAKFETTEEQRQKRQEDLTLKLEEARSALEDEKRRIRRDDELKQAEALQERDRMWNEHEQTVNAALREICQKPQYAFRAFDNANLPEGFDGSLKPDYMIEFLGQHIVFDAKVTRSQDINNYIREAVKSTAKKVKGNPAIYPVIFLVIPTDAVAEMKQLTFVEGGFTFFVISPDALEPILASFKKITAYELADQFDPQERESIVNWIAELDFHINARNSFDVLLAEMGAKMLTDTRRLNPELAEEVGRRQEKMKAPTLPPSEMKRLISSIVVRTEKIAELTEPSAKVRKQALLPD